MHFRDRRPATTKSLIAIGTSGYRLTIPAVIADPGMEPVLNSGLSDLSSNALPSPWRGAS